MTDLPTARVRPSSSWSAIWVLPLIALAIALWLAWEAYDERGIPIKVLFDSGEGIEVGKTQVVYKGMAIGVVKGLTLDDEGPLRGVVATLEMDKSATNYLRENTRFWLVKPNISLAGITGLETLVSGKYIAVSPGSGEPTRHFTALAQEPPLPDSSPGLHLTLRAERLGSLKRGSPVFYRQIQVGQVKDYLLAEDQRTIELKVFIRPEYADMVRRHTRFWNASGITVDASLSGVKVRTESLASVISGGIAFSTPAHRKDSPAADPSIPFRLFDDFAAAQAGIRITVRLEDFEGLQAGRTPVMYKGLQVGTLQTLNIDPDLTGATAELTMDPLMEDSLVAGTDFWVVKPSVSLAGINGLEALLKGNYIAVRPGEAGGEPIRKFTARTKAPPLDVRAPGRHLVLTSDSLGSLDVGSPVLYRQVRVGSVQSYQLAEDGQRVEFGVHIEPAYAGLVNSSSRFWNASGISMSGGLSGIEVRSESLQTLLAGGIAFETPDPRAPQGQRLQRFALHKDREVALRRGERITIVTSRGDGLGPGTPIRYRGIQLGQIDSVALSEDLQQVVLEASIFQAETSVAREGTRFWVVRPALGLMRTANLETLVTGPYLELEPGRSSAKRQSRFVALAQAPEPPLGEGLRLTLSAPRLGSIKQGNPVTYREIAVGRVVGYELGPSSDRVLISVLIDPRYVPLVHTGSRFWETSGIGVNFGLLKGLEVRTESLATLMEGGIAFATPEGAAMGNRAVPGQTFALFKEPQPEWLQWAPRIALPKAE